MNTTIAENQAASVITSQELLAHWQGHRGLTRKLIEAFPEKELFDYSLGGMRPFAGLIQEILAISAPGLKEIVYGKTETLNEHLEKATSKANILALWDEATEKINEYWQQIPVERFHDSILAFGMYEGTVLSSIQYYIDNEIHHRGQAYVYLRTLGIEPPAFWDR